MTTAELLRGARALYAKNPSHAGEGSLPEDGCECVMTALHAVAEWSTDDAYDALCDAAGIESGLVAWNAEHTTEEVLAAFDTAIEATS